MNEKIVDDLILVNPSVGQTVWFVGEFTIYRGVFICKEYEDGVSYFLIDTRDGLVLASELHATEEDALRYCRTFWEGCVQIIV